MDSTTDFEVEPVAASAVRTPCAQIIEALRGIQPFEGLTEDEFLWLARNGVEGSYGPGELIFREGDAPRGMNIMLRGEVHVRRQQAGNLSFFIARTGQRLMPVGQRVRPRSFGFRSRCQN